MTSLPAMSLGLRFCVSRKGGTGGGRWVYPLVFRSDLVGTGRAISILFGINGVSNKWSHLVGPPFPEFKARFSATTGWHFSRDLTRHLLIGGCGHSDVSVKYGCKLPLGAVLSLTTWENRNWGAFKSCREWKWPWEENWGLRSAN